MIKDIHLFTLAHEGDTSALDLAETLASRTGACVACTGLAVLPDGYLGYSESQESGAATQARREQRPGLLEFEATFKARTVAAAFELVEVYPKQIEHAVSVRAQRSDAAVVRAAPKSHETHHAALIEAAVIPGAAPVFVAPLHWHARDLGQRILVAWDGSANATRAAHEALRFAAPDAHVVVAVVEEQGGGVDAAAARHFAAHLARGRITAEALTYVLRGSVGSTLGHAAQDVGADLIAMGGYGRSGLSEAVFGGVTRTLLRSPDLPLLLAH